MASSIIWLRVENSQPGEDTFPGSESSKAGMDVKRYFIFIKTSHCILIQVGHSGLIFYGAG